MMTVACMVLYYIIISNTISMLFAQLVISGNSERTQEEIQTDLGNLPWWAQVVSNRTTALLLVGSLSLLFIFKKHLQELKNLSYVFLTVVFLFIALILVELFRETGTDKNYDDMMSMKLDHNLLTAFSIFIFAYSFQFMVFPAFVELEDKSNVRFAWSSFWSLVIYSFALISTGVIGVLIFGKEVRPDFLANISTRKGGVSVLIRTVYCFVLLFHLPYVFFTAKEYTLVMYDEIMNRSLSTHL